jgi:putative endonuclease
MGEAWLYIMSNRKNGILYAGVTNNIVRRATEHRTGAVKGFTTRHKLDRLVYLERHESIAAAIQRETTIKGWSRAWKVRLINSINPNWNDLYETIQA